MEIGIVLPLDRDGFLRRECPTCERQFKYHNGPANQEAEAQPPAVTYFCPFCGTPAAPDSWWTREQLDYAQASALPAFTRHMQDELEAAFRRSKHIRFTRGGGTDGSGVPHALTEPDDMQMVASPCHPYEPVKIPAGTTGPLYCLACGEAFEV